MDCKHCDYQFMIYKFAYRQMRRCPTCGSIYEMRFPSGVGFISILIALILAVIMTQRNSFPLMVSASVFILVYYLLDSIMKIWMIYNGSFILEEVHQ